MGNRELLQNTRFNRKIIDEIVAKLRRKEGNEFVEASLVLPIMVLLIIGVMSLTGFVFANLNARCELHKSLLSDKQDSTKIINKIKKEKETSSFIGGLVEERYVGEFEDASFKVHEADLIRLEDVMHEK